MCQAKYFCCEKEAFNNHPLCRTEAFLKPKRHAIQILDLPDCFGVVFFLTVRSFLVTVGLNCLSLFMASWFGFFLLTVEIWFGVFCLQLVFYLRFPTLDLVFFTYGSLAAKKQTKNIKFKSIKKTHPFNSPIFTSFESTQSSSLSEKKCIQF